MDDQPLPVLPESLLAERDAAVAAVHASVHAYRQALDAAPGLLAWLAEAGYDALLADSGDVVYAHLPRIGTRYFTDEDCRDYLDLPPQRRLTHATRLRYARERIREVVDEDDGYLFLSLAAFRLRDAQGRDAVLAGLIEVEGEAGPTLHWSGVFRSLSEHESVLDRKGCVPLDLALELPHFRLLSFWGAAHFDVIP